MKRKELWSGGDAYAYELTARDMEEIWEAESHAEEGIIEEHPVEVGD